MTEAPGAEARGAEARGAEARGAEALGGEGPTDWAALMRLGLGVLRLAPETFWAMTPVELDRALEGAGLAPHGRGLLGIAPGRAALEALMARFPDAAAGARGDGDADG
ncbi:MAG: rcc01693 family protein [Pseudomonadota bacterium]